MTTENYPPDVLRQTCPECRAAYGEVCLDRRTLGVGRYVAKLHPHASRVQKARAWQSVAKLGRRAGR